MAQKNPSVFTNNLPGGSSIEIDKDRRTISIIRPNQSHQTIQVKAKDLPNF